MAKKIRRRKVRTASSKEALTFVTSLQKRFQRRKRSAKEKERLRKYLARYSPDYLRSIARRVIIDIVNGPRQPARHRRK